MKIHESVQLFKQSLVNHFNGNEIKSLLAYMAEYVFTTSYFKITLVREKTLTEDQYNRLHHLLVELKGGKPVQQIVGYAYFMEHKIKINEHVLIPRPETEELVEAFLATVKTMHKALRILDIGTGSGCIAIAVKRAMPFAEVDAMDVSAEALDVARQNARFNEAAISFFYDDILNPGNELLQKKYNWLISNPPYIPTSEQPRMDRHVIDHEPTMALFVPDHEPLLFYQRIAAYGKHVLSEEGGVVVEMNAYHAPATRDIFVQEGYADVEIRNDMQDKPRILIARL